MLDGDLQNDPNDLIKMIEIFVKRKILVRSFRKKRNDPYLTKILPVKLQIYCEEITNSKISDHGCSLKIFDKK